MDTTDDQKIALGERRRRAQKREENRIEWIDYFERQYRAHSRLAASYAARAVALQDGETPTKYERS
jgi:hypothetical protein